MQKLGKNVGGYRGETIEIHSVLERIRHAATASGWVLDHFPAGDDLPLQAWHRRPGRRGRKIYVSTGIHGDEPAGPLAALRLLEANLWPADADLWLCPCLNPTGFPLNRRENRFGIDLNRQYRQPEAPETRAHIAWLERQPEFDVTLCLHEDWEAAGFYLYELNPDQRPSPSEEILRRVEQVCPIDRSTEIEGRAASDGIIRPTLDLRSLPEWPEALWLVAHKTRHSYTLEAPSDFPLPTRVDALVLGVQGALGLLS